MTTDMEPPPHQNPNTTTAAAEEPIGSIPDDVSTSKSAHTSMKPPPPKFLSTSDPEPSQLDQEKSQSSSVIDTEPSGNANSQDDSSSSSVSQTKEEQEQRSGAAAVPYTIPTWSGRPCHQYYLEVLKDGSIIDKFDVNKKGAYMFGRVDLCDFVLEHPTISRFHAVLQFKGKGNAYVYDLGSTHGTFVNKNQVKKRVYVELHVGDVLRFGHSSRLYIFQGPTDLMPPEADRKKIKQFKIREEMQDMEESLLRAKLDASRADGISWGMREDAIEENEDEVEEITWQTYKGLLTEKQEKTRDKVVKRLEKIAHMKKEIDAIRAKDIAQGGLTQGQQTQIARNEQRISQILEELENLEETLNESIRESLGARTGRTSRGKKKGPDEEEEEEYSSEEDEFYDRTQKPTNKKSGENQSIETADSLLDKKDAIVKEMEDKRRLLDEKDGTGQESEVEAGDDLDAYMSGLSSQLALEKKEKLDKELSTLQSELDRVLYLLKIADPTGEAAKKRELKVQEPNTNLTKTVATDAHQQPPPEKKKKDSVKPKDLTEKQGTVDANSTLSQETEKEIGADAADGKNVVYTVSKPQWLGAVEEKKKQETVIERQTEHQENDQFVDYKDRNRILAKPDTTHLATDSGLESAAPGLIIRKRKQVEKSDATAELKASEQSAGDDLKAEDAVALLLRHSRRYHGADEEVECGGDNVSRKSPIRNAKKKHKKVLGPERPSSLKSETDYDSWVPPEGQSGDGRTSLNDRLGY